MDFNQPCALILWVSDFGLQMGKICQFLTDIFPPYDSCGVLSFHVFICVLYLYVL